MENSSKKLLIREKLKEYTEFELDLQRIAIRRFFIALEEIKEEQHQGIAMKELAKIYGFDREDILRFVRAIRGIKYLRWIRGDLS